jgi:hypothetical protein
LSRADDALDRNGEPDSKRHVSITVAVSRWVIAVMLPVLSRPLV